MILFLTVLISIYVFQTALTWDPDEFLKSLQEYEIIYPKVLLRTKRLINEYERDDNVHVSIKNWTLITKTNPRLTLSPNFVIQLIHSNAELDIKSENLKIPDCEILRGHVAEIEDSIVILTICENQFYGMISLAGKTYLYQSLRDGRHVFYEDKGEERSANKENLSSAKKSTNFVNERNSDANVFKIKSNKNAKDKIGKANDTNCVIIEINKFGKRSLIFKPELCLSNFIDDTFEKNYPRQVRNGNLKLRQGNLKAKRIKMKSKKHKRKKRSELEVSQKILNQSEDEFLVPESLPTFFNIKKVMLESFCKDSSFINIAFKRKKIEEKCLGIVGSSFGTINPADHHFQITSLESKNDKESDKLNDYFSAFALDHFQNSMDEFYIDAQCSNFFDSLDVSDIMFIEPAEEQNTQTSTQSTQSIGTTTETSHITIEIQQTEIGHSSSPSLYPTTFDNSNDSHTTNSPIDDTYPYTSQLGTGLTDSAYWSDYDTGRPTNPRPTSSEVEENNTTIIPTNHTHSSDFDNYYQDYGPPSSSTNPASPSFDYSNSDYGPSSSTYLPPTSSQNGYEDYGPVSATHPQISSYEYVYEDYSTGSYTNSQFPSSEHVDGDYVLASSTYPPPSISDYSYEDYSLESSAYPQPPIFEYSYEDYGLVSSSSPSPSSSDYVPASSSFPSPPSFDYGYGDYDPVSPTKPTYLHPPIYDYDYAYEDYDSGNPTNSIYPESPSSDHGYGDYGVGSIFYSDQPSSNFNHEYGSPGSSFPLHPPSYDYRYEDDDSGSPSNPNPQFYGNGYGDYKPDSASYPRPSNSELLTTIFSKNYTFAYSEELGTGVTGPVHWTDYHTGSPTYPRPPSFSITSGSHTSSIQTNNTYSYVEELGTGVIGPVHWTDYHTESPTYPEPPSSTIPDINYTTVTPTNSTYQYSGQLGTGIIGPVHWTEHYTGIPLYPRPSSSPTNSESHTTIKKVNDTYPYLEELGTGVTGPVHWTDYYTVSPTYSGPPSSTIPDRNYTTVTPTNHTHLSTGETGTDPRPSSSSTTSGSHTTIIKANDTYPYLQELVTGVTGPVQWTDYYTESLTHPRPPSFGITSVNYTTTIKKNNTYSYVEELGEGVTGPVHWTDYYTVSPTYPGPPSSTIPDRNYTTVIPTNHTHLSTEETGSGITDPLHWTDHYSESPTYSQITISGDSDENYGPGTPLYTHPASSETVIENNSTTTPKNETHLHTEELETWVTDSVNSSDNNTEKPTYPQSPSSDYGSGDYSLESSTSVQLSSYDYGDENYGTKTPLDSNPVSSETVFVNYPTTTLKNETYLHTEELEAGITDSVNWSDYDTGKPTYPQPLSSDYGFEDYSSTFTQPPSYDYGDIDYGAETPSYSHPPSSEIASGNYTAISETTEMYPHSEELGTSVIGPIDWTDYHTGSQIPDYGYGDYGSINPSDSETPSADTETSTRPTTTSTRPSSTSTKPTTTGTTPTATSTRSTTISTTPTDTSTTHTTTSTRPTTTSTRPTTTSTASTTISTTPTATSTTSTTTSTRPTTIGTTPTATSTTSTTSSTTPITTSTTTCASPTTTTTRPTTTTTRPTTTTTRPTTTTTTPITTTTTPTTTTTTPTTTTTTPTTTTTRPTTTTTRPTTTTTRPTTTTTTPTTTTTTPTTTTTTPTTTTTRPTTTTTTPTTTTTRPTTTTTTPTTTTTRPTTTSTTPSTRLTTTSSVIQHRPTTTSDPNQPTKLFYAICIVVDYTIIQFHSEENAWPYFLNLMNMVSEMLMDSTLNSRFAISISKFIVFRSKSQGQVVPSNKEYSLIKVNSWNIDRQLESEVKDATTIWYTRHTLGNSYSAQYTGSVCNSHFSCGIVEDLGFASVYITSHALGHILGFSHDGDSESLNYCESNNFTIMSKNINIMQENYYWSECNRREYDSYEKLGLYKCMESKLSNPVLNLPYYGNDQSIIFTLDYQCRIDFGNNYVFCPKIVDDPCKQLWCKDITSQEIHCESRNKRPMDGTACGKNYHCYQGCCSKRPLH